MPRIPFGGKKVSFSNRKETLEQVFGNSGLSPAEMNKKLWSFIKQNNLFK